MRMPAAGLPWRAGLLATAITLTLGLALTGCSADEADGTGSTAARATAPCSLLSSTELSQLGRTHLVSGFAVGDQQEADGNPGSRVCQYRLQVSSADAGLELYTYTANAQQALSYYRSLTTDGEQLSGLGDASWWSTRGQQLLILKDDILVLVHFQLPRAYRDKNRALGVAVGRVVTARL